MKKTNQKTQGLAKLLLLAKSEQEMEGLLHDLFTESEIGRAHERVKIFSCLKDGMSQREAKKEANAAIVTVTHGAQFLRNSAMIIKEVIDSAQRKNWWQKFF